MRERPFRALAELRALEPAVQVAQPIVMPGDLIAFIEQPCFLGTFGIALGPGCQDQDAERIDLVGKGFWRCYRRIIAPR